MTTQIHGTVADWASDLIDEGVALGVWRHCDFRLVCEGRLDGFVAQYEGM